MKFSVITVCLNSGEKLAETVENILEQTCEDFEIVIKDGGSRDGSVEEYEHAKDPRIRLFREKDSGIYEAMNQAVAHARGEYVIFMNCGDHFASDDVLERALKAVEEVPAEDAPLVLYGDTMSLKNHVVIPSSPKITGFTCYRNIPCHQACIYDRRLFAHKQYNPEYRIRADYDHFLWCYYRGGAHFVYLQFPVACYEGGGFSEKKENRERDRREHEMITTEYMSGGALLSYRMVMLLSLAPIRTAMAESKLFSGIYQRVKNLIYGKK